MRSRWVAPVSLVAGIAIALSFWCAVARADAAAGPKREKFTFRQQAPAYIGTNYSNSAEWSKAATPYVRAQIAQAMTGRPVGVAGLDFRPELSFVWRAMLWPVGAVSSPIEENNYLPGAGITINAAGANDEYAIVEREGGATEERILWREDTDGLWRGAWVGYLHQSTGTDSNSGSWDRVGGWSKFGGKLLIAGRVIDVTGTATVWYVVNVGSETAGLLDYVNFGLWRDAGGQVAFTVTVPDFGRVEVTFGLSYQNYEMFIPLAASWDISLFGQFHHGNFERMGNYRERPDAGIVGIAYAPAM